MQSVHTTARTSEDGTLTIQVATSLRAADVEVTVVFSEARTGIAAGWPDGFIEATAGRWHGEPLERGEQGDYPLREPLD